METNNNNRGLRSIVIKNLIFIAVPTILVLLIGLTATQIIVGNGLAHNMADESFAQIREVLNNNQSEGERIDTEYHEALINEARSIALTLQYSPEIVSSKDSARLQKIADTAGVQEINILDKAGTVVFGTNPAHIGSSIKTDERFGEFAPMFADHGANVVSTSTFNNGAGVPLQYRAVWSEDESFVVHVGVDWYTTYMVRTEPYYLSHTFSLLTRPEGTTLFATSENGEAVLGSTDSSMVEKSLAELGLRPLRNDGDRSQQYIASLQGDLSYVFLREIDGTMVGCAFSVGKVFGDIFIIGIGYGLAMMLVVAVLIFAVTKLVDKLVISNIDTINADLHRITNGDLSVRIGVRDSREFSNLSHFINDMVQSMIASRKQIERERDMDLLTGLYNRRGMQREIDSLRKTTDDMGKCALLMIDLDGLKQINDVYGHQNGDKYLQGLADVLRRVSGKNCIYARHGGDEFIMFLHGFATDEELTGAIAKVQACQDGQTIPLSEGVEAELSFSVGVCFVQNQFDLEDLMRDADKKMYENKRVRKGKASQQ